MNTSSGERLISGYSVSVIQSGLSVPAPVFMNTRALGGGPVGLQAGFTDTSGVPSPELNNIGLLVTICGKITYADPSGQFFYVDDGGRIQDGSGWTGVRVACSGLRTANTGDSGCVTGISSTTMLGGKMVRLLRPRTSVDISYPIPPPSLVNPGFETGTLSGWTSYGHTEPPHTGTWFGEITARSGSWFFGNAAHYGTKTGGLYQRLPATPGAKYRAKVWSRVYRGDNPENSVQNRIGIDPTGGVDPNSPTVQWSPTDTQPTSYYSIWKELSTPLVTCTAGYITVFLDAKQMNTEGWHINCFDDASLFGE